MPEFHDAADRVSLLLGEREVWPADGLARRLALIRPTLAVAPSHLRSRRR